MLMVALCPTQENKTCANERKLLTNTPWQRFYYCFIFISMYSLLKMCKMLHETQISTGKYVRRTKTIITSSPEKLEFNNTG